jgi:hypothetical protein
MILFEVTNQEIKALHSIQISMFPSVVIFFQAHSQNCEKRLLALSCPSVHLYIRMEQLSSHVTDFDEI